jgi:hypothetical protein
LECGREAAAFASPEVPRIPSAASGQAPAVLEHGLETRGAKSSHHGAVLANRALENKQVTNPCYSLADRFPNSHWE